MCSNSCVLASIAHHRIAHMIAYNERIFIAARIPSTCVLAATTESSISLEVPPARALHTRVVMALFYTTWCVAPSPAPHADCWVCLPDSVTHRHLQHTHSTRLDSRRKMAVRSTVWDGTLARPHVWHTCIPTRVTCERVDRHTHTQTRWDRRVRPFCHLIS